LIERMNLSIPASANRVRNAIVNWASRSMRRNRFSRANPGFIRARCHACGVNATAARLDGEQDLHRDETVSTPHRDGREIDGGDCRLVSAQESAPRQSAAALGAGSMPFPSRAGDRGPGHVMTEMGQGALDPAKRTTTLRYQVRLVSGVTSPARSNSALLPTALPATASRRRRSSISRIRRSPSCSRRMRFSSRRKSIAARKTCQG